MKSIPAILILFALTGCKSENQYIIKGTVKGDFDNHWVYLVKFMEPEPDIDSCYIRNGKFSFMGSIEYPELFVLHNNPDSLLGFFPFFLEPARIKIELNIKDWTWGSSIDGGNLNEEYNRLFRIPETELVKLNIETEEKMTAADSTEKAELESVRKKVEEEHMKLERDYFTKHPDSPFSPYLLAKSFFMLPLDESEKILTTFSEENKQTSICLSLQDRLDRMHKYEEGSLEAE